MNTMIVLVNIITLKMQNCCSIGIIVSTFIKKGFVKLTLSEFVDFSSFSLKYDFYQNLWKSRIFYHYISDVFEFLPVSNHPILARISYCWGSWCSCYQCHFWAISWLVLDRLCKPYFNLHCIRVIVYTV